MSHSSFTASERRGMLAIGIVALLTIAVGVWYSGNEGYRINAEDEVEVVAHPEMIDSTVFLNQKEALKKRNKKKTAAKKVKKEIRKRSHLDEPL